MSDKATKELLDLVITVSDAVKAARADGVINIFDLPKLAPVLPKLRAAIQDASQVPGELQALSPAELQELLTLAVTALTKIVDAVFSA